MCLLHSPFLQSLCWPIKSYDCLPCSFCIFNDLFCALWSCKCHKLSFGTLCTFCRPEILNFAPGEFQGSYDFAIYLPFIFLLLTLYCISALYIPFADVVLSFACFFGHCLRPIKDFNPIRSKLFYKRGFLVIPF